MAMRLSGLMSGMDTESIISQLVESRKTKVDNTKKAQTKLEWKQDAWKSLNTKLKNLQSKYLSNMRFTTAYSKKVTKVSNPNAVSVITGEDAVNGVQSLEIRKLAKTGYLTGGQITSGNGKLTASSKLSELGVTSEGSINVSTGNGTSVDIKVNGDSTISDVLTQLKNAGLNANFDEGNQRFFVSSKESGAASDFSISAMDGGGLAALQALGLQESVKKIDINNISDEDFAKLSATEKEYVTYARYYDENGDRAQTIKNMESLISKDVQSRTDSYLAQYKSLVDAKDAAQKKIDDINQQYADAGKTLKSVEQYEADLEALNQDIASKEELLNQAGSPLTDDERSVLEERLVELKKQAADITAEKADAETLKTQQETITKADSDMADVQKYVTISGNATDG
ncbi:MAG: hypothetical protein K2O34_04270, partial [Acetatifactor sp.]|nr:hypothetical protein [Acetatifactor sp.]